MRGNPTWRRRLTLEVVCFAIIVGSFALIKAGTVGTYVGLLIVVLVLGYIVLSIVRS